MFVTNWISTTKIQKISEITNFFRHYFLSRTEVILADGSSLVEGLSGYVANRLREFNIIQEYYRGNRNMSIFEKSSSKDISEKLEFASVISQYKKNQKIIKELSIEKLPLIQINGKTKSSYYDISDYQYMVEI